jgi:general secretion pathway protein M
VIGAWWNGLSPKDRRTLAIGGGVAAVLLGWALIWHPLARKRADLERDLAMQRRDLAYVQAGAAEIGRLHGAGERSRADREGKSLLALADATARAGGLESALKRVEPVGVDSVRVSFEMANFDALVQWLEGLSTHYGVEASDLSADRADGLGLVNARVTLRDAP